MEIGSILLYRSIIIELLFNLSMAVTKIGEKFVCSVCGNEVTVVKVGGGTMVCCGKEMILKME